MATAEIKHEELSETFKSAPKEVSASSKLATLIDEKNSIMKRQICDIEDPNLTDDEENNQKETARI